MEQVEDVKRYRKVIETVNIKVVAVKDGDRPITKTKARQSIQDWIDADEIGDELFIKSFDNRYDVDDTTLLGWTAEVVRFEWRTVKSKTSETTAVVRREPKAQPTHDRKGRPITYTNGNRLVNRRGYNPATVVKKTTATPLTAEQIEERKLRLRGGHFIGATYLGK